MVFAHPAPSQIHLPGWQAPRPGSPTASRYPQAGPAVSSALARTRANASLQTHSLQDQIIWVKIHLFAADSTAHSFLDATIGFKVALLLT